MTKYFAAVHGRKFLGPAQDMEVSAWKDAMSYLDPQIPGVSGPYRESQLHGRPYVRQSTPEGDIRDIYMPPAIPTTPLGRGTKVQGTLPGENWDDYDILSARQFRSNANWAYTSAPPRREVTREGIPLTEYDPEEDLEKLPAGEDRRQQRIV